MKLLVTGGAGYIGSRRGAASCCAPATRSSCSTTSRAATAARSRRAPSSLEVDLLDAAALATARSPAASTACCTSPRSRSSASRSSTPSATGATTSSARSTCSTRCAPRASSGSSSPRRARPTASPSAVPIAEDAPTAPGQPVRRVEARGRPDDRRRVPRPRPRRDRRCATSTSPARAATLGEDHDPETHLIPLRPAAPRAGRREHVSIFGTDYPTPDGTAVRDYIHVEDLARRAPARARRGSRPAAHQIFNLGNGDGFSVREVDRRRRARVDRPRRSRRARRRGAPATRRCSWPRASGSAPSWAGSRASPSSTTMIADAWAWRQAHPDGYARLDPPAGRSSSAASAAASTAPGSACWRRARGCARARRRRARRRPPRSRAKNASPRARGGRRLAAAAERARGPRAGSIRSSSVRSGGRPPVANVVDRAHRLDAQPAARALVGERGVDEAVEQHPLAGVEQRRAAPPRRAARARPRRAAPRRARRRRSAGSLTSARMRSDSSTPPGSRRTARRRPARPSARASAVASVVLPAPSRPSIVIRRPRAMRAATRIADGRDR